MPFDFVNTLAIVIEKPRRGGRLCLPASLARDAIAIQRISRADRLEMTK